MTKRSDNGACWLIMLSAGIALSVISALALTFSYVRYRQARELYSAARRAYVRSAVKISEQPDASGSPDDAKAAGLTDEELVGGIPWYELASVDVNSLREEYPDTVGWIYFENEDISYPVMYSGDNKKYLHTSYTGEHSSAGALFLDGGSQTDLSDPYSIIYGHNMRDLSMFGKLKYYRTDGEYYDSHRFFQIFDGEHIYRYKIFAYEVVKPSHPMYQACGSDPGDLDGLLEMLWSDSIEKTDVPVSASDHVITLSTCTSGGKERMTVSAVRVGEHE